MFQSDDATIKVHRPSLREKIFFLISGIILSVPLTLFVERFANTLVVMLPTFYALLTSIAILAPFIEEFAKAYPLFYRHGETQRSLFTLGFLVGLGFGVSEFFLYVLTLGAPVYTRLPVLFFHAASTSITAYGIATKRTAWFYLTAVALHSSRNFFLLLGQFWFIGELATAIAYFISWRLYRAASEITLN